MSQKESSNNFMLGVALALGMIISALLITSTMKFIKSGNQTITVKGYAEKEIVSDYAVWSSSFSVFSSDRKTAYSELESHLKIVMKYLNQNGISDNMITIDAVITSPHYQLNEQGYSTGVITGYELVQNIRIGTKNIYLADKLSRKSTELIKSGINFNSMMPEYYYTKLNDLKIKMVGEAAKDATTRADQLAENSGGSIGRLMSAKQGVFQITGTGNASEISDYGMYDVSSIKKTIKSVVTMEYSIE